MKDLGTLGGDESYGYDINNAGQVTGSSEIPPAGSYHDHAFLYSNGQMIDLGTLGGLYSSQALGINNARQVVGYSYTSDCCITHAFLYQNGQMYDLNNLIDPAVNITLQSATAINDNGQIVANTADPGYREHSVLLTPIPEPSTLALFGMALLGLGAWARRHKAHS